MKYIIFKQINEEMPVIFPSALKHSDVAEAMEKATYGARPVSAGFIMTNYSRGILKCYGDSMTLNLPAREIDTNIVNKFLGLLE
jgi:hypothetical protein